MRLYEIRSPLKFPHIPMNGGNCDEVILAYLLANDEAAVYDYIERRYYPGNEYQEPGWDACSSKVNEYMTREEIIKNRGDYTAENPESCAQTFWYGEFYELGCRWIDLGEISSEEVSTLQRFGILPTNP